MRPTVPRWTDKEHDILIQLTKDQLALESTDKSNVISWTEHWKQVSSNLRQYGFKRSYTACGAYWKRTIETQLADEEAAGSRWHDCEHQMLLRMTEEQLSLEDSNRSLVIPWAKHWENVSIQLEDSGYTRSAEACAAYWRLLETNFSLLGESESDAETYSRQANNEIDNESMTRTPVQLSKSSDGWTNTEHTNLVRLLKQHGEPGKRTRLDEASEIEAWSLISRRHREGGFNRTWEACKMYWQSNGKSQDSTHVGVESSSTTGIERTVITPARSRTSPSNQVSSSDINPVLSNTMETPMSHSEPVQLRSTQLTGEGEGIKESQTPIRPHGMSPRKQRPRMFRFTPRQKIILEAEAANSPFPNADRRAELALQLGAKEKTIQNWFTTFRRKSRFLHASLEPNHSHSNQHSTSDASTMREQHPDETFDIDSHTEDSASIPFQSRKKPRLEGVPVSDPDIAEEVYIHDTGSQWRNNTPAVRNSERQTSPHERSDIPRNEQLASLNATVSRDPDQGACSTVNSTDQINQSPVLPLFSASEVSENNTSSPAFSESTENERPPMEEPNLTPTPNQVEVNIVEKTEPATSIASNSQPNSQPDPQNEHSCQYSKVATNPILEIPQLAAAPLETPAAPLTDEEVRQQAARKVQIFQNDIQNLAIITAARQVVIEQINQDIEGIKMDENELNLQEDEEIYLVLKAINERYEAQRQCLKEKRNELIESQETQMDELNKQTLELTRKKIGMKRFQLVVDFYDNYESGN